MDTETHAFRTTDGLLDAVRRLVDLGITGAPVVDGRGKLVGSFSEVESLRLLSVGDGSGQAPSGKVADLMGQVPATVSPDMDLYYVTGLFLRFPTVRRYPVVEDGRLIGVITRKDVLRAIVGLSRS